MNRIAPVILICASLPGLLRCATITYHEKLGDRGREVREFENIDSGEKAYQGTAEERSVINGRTYYHLQFEGPLAGNGRYLDIFVPHEYNGKLVITESDKKLAGEKKAFLLVERSCCSEGYKDVFERYNVTAIPGPVQDIKRIFHADVTAKDSPVVFIKLSFTNVKKFYAHHVIWELKGAGAVASGGFHMEQPYSMIGVRWKQRNPAVIGLIKVGYIAPVIADIISSPVQLIGVIIYFAMGGAVK